MPGEKNVASKALSPTFILGRAKKQRSKKKKLEQHSIESWLINRDPYMEWGLYGVYWIHLIGIFIC